MGAKAGGKTPASRKHAALTGLELLLPGGQTDELTGGDRPAVLLKLAALCLNLLGFSGPSVSRLQRLRAACDWYGF